jgi:Amt family ammonium transporter
MRSKRAAIYTAIIVGITCAAGAAWAQEPTQSAKIDSGDTAWVMISAALVLLMTAPGLALFYGGMVRRKNVLATLMQSFILCGLVSVQWVLFGYSLAFGPDWHGLIGSLAWAGLNGVGAAPNPE